MAKRKRKMTQEKMAQWIKEGRGQGEGHDYDPWLHIQDVPSSTTVSRLPGLKVDREYHCMSPGEADYVRLADLSPQVLDIREQYPLLPQFDTLEIASTLGIQHPCDPKSKELIVMTTDFLIVVKCGLSTNRLARTYKPSSLLSGRVLEKFEIERQYWGRRKVDWGIVTEHELPEIIADNGRELHLCFPKIFAISHRYQGQTYEISDAEIERIAVALTPGILEGKRSLKDLCEETDQVIGCPPGVSLRVARHHVARGRWPIDLTRPIKAWLPLPLKQIDKSG